MTQLSSTQIVKVCLFVAGLWCLVTGAVDLDWMLVENHFDMWNAEKDTWEFSPHLTMNWWDAYMFSVIRLVVGTAIMSIFVYREAKA